MGSSKIFKPKQQSQESSAPVGNQYVKLSDGTLSLYDPNSIQYNYSKQEPKQQSKNIGNLGANNISASKLSKDNGVLQNATFNGQDVELDGGKLRLYSENDYNTWKTEQQAAEQKAAEDLANKRKEAQQSLLDNRNAAANKKRKNKNSMLSPSGTAPTGGSGAYTGIIE